MEEKILCTVQIDGETHTSDDFVAVLSKENGDASIMYNTDALTLGMSLKMIARAFVQCMHECSEEERNEIAAILDTAEIADLLKGEEA